MGWPKSGDAASRFSAYVEGLASVIGHADRAKPLRDYCVGLMMPCVPLFVPQRLRLCGRDESLRRTRIRSIRGLSW